MMRAVPAVLLIVLMAAGGACREHEAEGGPSAERRSAPIDGSLCEEHGVFEALCSKCNPALIPVFKSKGDWCEEHGFMMSLCPVHNPERRGRPPVDVAGDDAPAEGTKVRFKTMETARLAGIRTAKAVARPVAPTVTAPARIVYDAARVVRLSARAPGVVRSIKVDVGERVRPGTLLSVIESASAGADASALRAAAARMEVAAASLERATRLRAEGIAPERDVLAARREVEEARASLASAEVALGVIGPLEGSSGRYTLTSPIAGVVTRRSATVGQVVSVEDVIFEVVDSSVMWAEIDVPEADLDAVAVGQRVLLSSDGSQDYQLGGELVYIAPEIDVQTRTAKARVPIENPTGRLRANMFVEARITVAHPRVSVLVPAAAVQRARSVDLVFVRLGEDLYEARRVRHGASEGDLVEVVGNLRQGDEVATEGSFLLKTETLRESIGAGCCDVE